MKKINSNKNNKIISLTLVFAIVANMFINITCVEAEDTSDLYPYTLFAASDMEGAITVSSNYACMNGSIATNGTIVMPVNGNINGNVEENVGEAMIYMTNRLQYMCFSGEECDTYRESYSLSQMNININNSILSSGNVKLEGNVAMNAGIFSNGNILVSGSNINSNNSVLCSTTGDIIFNGDNVSLSGLVYAPDGNVVINAQTVNMNSVVVIADTITINCNFANINYNYSMAELVGVESEIELEVFAFGEYLEETNELDIVWFSTVSKGTYEIEVSEDNIVYSSVGSIENETKYNYAISDEFENRYFRVTETTYYGEVKSSVPFVVTKSEEGYKVDFLDTDSDFVPDVSEDAFGTNVNLKDTDEDGLSDYEEVILVNSDPLIYDSILGGVSDADADSDADGLTNYEEILIGTDLLLYDSDEDGLSDYEEVYEYEADPLNEDTDGDTLLDGEEPFIGLNPSDPTTFDVPDQDYMVMQTISSDSEVFSEVNGEERPFDLSLEIEAAGYVEGSLSVAETTYANVIHNEAMVGIAPELTYTSERTVHSVKVSFKMSQEYVDGIVNAYSDEELHGIKKLVIFKFFEEVNMLLPIETQYDVENNLVYAETDELGTYCIMDIEEWVDQFNFSEEDLSDVPMTISILEEEETEEETRIEIDDSESVDEEYSEEIVSNAVMTLGLSNVYEVTPIDAVFILQASGQRPYVFDSQKQMIVDLMSMLVTEYGSNSIRVCIITYNTSGATMMKATDGGYWFVGSSSLQQALNEVEYQVLDDETYTDRGTATQLLYDEVEFKESASKFVFQIMNGTSNVGNYYFDQLDLCKKMSINYSEVMPSGFSYSDTSYEQKVNAAIANTNGINIRYSSDCASVLFEHIGANVAEAQLEFGAIVATGWKMITLNGVLDSENGIDTDGDSLTDWAEVNTELLKWQADGSIELPTIGECMKYVDRPYVEMGLFNYILKTEIDSRFRIELEKILNNTRILPINSDPTLADTDGDGLLDGEAVYVSTKKVAPQDPTPLKYTGEKGLWANHIKEQQEGVIAYNYSEDDGLEVGVEQELADELVSYILYLREALNEYGDDIRPKLMWIKDLCESLGAEGAYLLNFIYDDKDIAYHSQPDTWQREFGYNDFYDDVFRVGSSMDFLKIEFDMETSDELGEEFVIWLWKGDYWNLQSGAEIGLYVFSGNTYVNNTKHYYTVNFELPMSLSLYNYYRAEEIENVFNWAPNVDQWWITGFNPDFTEPDCMIMETVGSIDFTGHEELYLALKENAKNPELVEKYIVFDNDGHTAWITW